MELSDLIAAARGGSEGERGAAFTELVRRFQDMAFACAFSLTGDAHLAQDAAQEAFLTAWQELASLREPAAFPGWLRRLVVSACGRLRRGSRSEVPLERAAELPDPAASPQAAVERGETRDTVRAAVLRLPPSERMVITLFYVSRFSQKEIGRFLELPVTTVQKRLYTGRQRLRRLLAPLAERSLVMVQEGLQEQRPSRDERFERTVRLFQAAGSGDAAAVRAVLEADPSLTSARRKGIFGERTALHVAAENGHTEVVRALLDAGADVSCRDEGDHATALHWAAGAGRLETARLLVERGADVNAADDMHERGPLGWSLLNERQPEVAEYLIERGARVDLFAAVALGDEARVRAMVAADPAALSARMSLCEDYQSALHFAVDHDRPEMVRLLIDLGADVNAATPSGFTPLCRAIEKGREAIRAMLLEAGAGVDLLSAIATGDRVRVDALAAAGLDPGVLDAALRFAAAYGDAALARRLLAMGAEVNSRGSWEWMRGVTPLILACFRNREEAALALLDAGADPTLKDEYPGATALHWAAWEGNPVLLARLIEAGADPLVEDDLYHAPAFGWATENRKDAAIDFFLERGHPVHMATAAYIGRLELVERELEAHPETLNEVRGSGAPLHQAALHGFTEIVRLLLDHGADLQAPNRDGDTALTVVRRARKGELHPGDLPAHREIERLLVERGRARAKDEGRGVELKDEGGQPE